MLKRELLNLNIDVLIPQCSPLSPGEILGCTSPKLPSNVGAIVYVGDGRFHLESIMIQNPHIKAYQYNPYSRKLTKEDYGFEIMVRNRSKAIKIGKDAGCFGLIQGTIGRQGNPRIFNDLETKLVASDKQFVRVLLSEIFANKLALFPGVEW